MERQPKQTAAYLPEIIAAQADLARLAFNKTANDKLNTTATRLLTQLLAVCAAQRGACLLVSSPPTHRDVPGQQTSLHSRSAQICALHNMQKEEALNFISSFSTEDIQTLPSVGEVFWLLWRPPLSLPTEQDPSREEKTSETMRFQQALFVFGWEPGDKQKQALEVQKAIAILPHLTETVGVVIINALLLEYILDIETISYREDLREMEFLKAEMLASVSHELRGPLATVKGYAATLLRHEQHISPEERHEFLVAINESSDRLARVVDAFLEMSELETGSIVIHRSAVNIGQLVREAIMAVEQQLRAEASAAPTLINQPSMGDTSRTPWVFAVHLLDSQEQPLDNDLIIQADQRRLREVMDQLLANAVTHAQSSGNIHIVIRSGMMQDTLNSLRFPSKKMQRRLFDAMQRHHRMLAISVSDDGKGIQPQHLERIFERFYRVDTALTREVNGLGLGLTACKRIVELHDGVMWAESEFGKGSTFHVFLPMHETAKSNSI